MNDSTFHTHHLPMKLIVIVVLVTLLLVACGGAEAPLTVPAGAQAGDLVGMESCIYEVDDVVYAADCGTLVVPENRNDPEARLIALPIIKVRATGDNPTEPIFWLTGGPGASNMHFKHFEGLLDDHDIVMVGYRGVDGSVVLDCPDVTKAWGGKGGDLFGDENEIKVGDKGKISRWIFKDISDISFKWESYISIGYQDTWKMDQEVFAKRKV